MPHAGGARPAEQGVDFITATAESVDAVWSRLRVEAELADVRRPSGTSIETRAQRVVARASDRRERRA